MGRETWAGGKPLGCIHRQCIRTGMIKAGSARHQQVGMGAIFKQQDRVVGGEGEWW
jgi:hypothetical protein